MLGADKRRFAILANLLKAMPTVARAHQRCNSDSHCRQPAQPGLSGSRPIQYRVCPPDDEVRRQCVSFPLKPSQPVSWLWSAH
jgi:hypothetical protein